MKVRTYNDGGITFREAFGTARQESIDSGKPVTFEFALVKIKVTPKTRYGAAERKWVKGVSGISYLPDNSNRRNPTHRQMN